MLVGCVLLQRRDLWRVQAAANNVDPTGFRSRKEVQLISYDLQSFVTQIVMLVFKVKIMRLESSEMTDCPVY